MDETPTFAIDDILSGELSPLDFDLSDAEFLDASDGGDGAAANGGDVNTVLAGVDDLPLFNDGVQTPFPPLPPVSACVLGATTGASASALPPLQQQRPGSSCIDAGAVPADESAARSADIARNRRKARRRTLNKTRRGNGATSSQRARGCKDEGLSAKELERKRRNRESAALSRKRKREYTQRLESQVAELTRENQQLTGYVNELAKSNEDLKAQLGQLEQLLVPTPAERAEMEVEVAAEVARMKAQASSSKEQSVASAPTGASVSKAGDAVVTTATKDAPSGSMPGGGLLKGVCMPLSTIVAAPAPAPPMISSLFKQRLATPAADAGHSIAPRPNLPTAASS